MQRQLHRWWSPALHREMDIAVYGHYGPALLMFPTADEDFLEYERCGVIDAIAPLIDAGKLKVFSITSVFRHSWFDDSLCYAQMAATHRAYNTYVEQEVLQYMYNHCKGRVPVLTTGASLGALLAVNAFLRKPDVYSGTIALSGVYSLEDYADDFFDDTIYFNSPATYLPNLTDDAILTRLRSNKTIIIATGQGKDEEPDMSREFSSILNAKSIPHTLDLWGYDMPHDWPTWHLMYKYFLSTINL
ncbi:MAG: esterase [Ignavibacteria bacterium]|nr:esterase [Ignavibacteria bacterium]